METLSPAIENMRKLTPTGEPLTVLVPTGSMRNRYLDFLLRRGFCPPDNRLPEKWQQETKEERYENRDILDWQKDGYSPIDVLIRDRKSIADHVSKNMNGQPALGFTNSDVVLTAIAKDEQRVSGKRVMDNLKTYDIPIPSGRSGGISRWAILAPKEQWRENGLYPESYEINAITENPVLVQYFCKKRIGGLIEAIASRITNVSQVDGQEEARLMQMYAERNGVVPVLIGIVESGKSAEAFGLMWQEIIRVKAQAVLSKTIVNDRPDIAAAVQRAFCLKTDSLCEYPPVLCSKIHHKLSHVQY